MKNTMKKLAAALLALTCLPVTGMTAFADETTSWSGVAAWDAFAEWEFVGHGKYFNEPDAMIFWKEPERDDSNLLGLVRQNRNSIRFSLREDAPRETAEKQVMQTVDAYIPGILDNYDALNHRSRIPFPEGTNEARYYIQAGVYFSGADNCYEVYIYDLPDHADEIEAGILLDLAKEHLISEFYGWGETAYYDTAEFWGLKHYKEQQDKGYDMQSPEVRIYETPDWDAAKKYIEEHHAGCSIEHYLFEGVEPYYRVTGIENMTRREQLGIACELWQQFDIFPLMNIWEASGPNVVGHNALERPGDTNLDCEVDIMDVIAANKHLLGASQLDKTGMKNADTNGDGLVDSADTLDILKTVLEISG